MFLDKVLPYLIVATALVILLCILSYGITLTDKNTNKLLPYECGFIPFDDTRYRINLEFHVIAILFMIFDVELIVLIPVALATSPINTVSILALLILLAILFLGFIIEWLKISIFTHTDSFQRSNRLEGFDGNL